MTLFYPGMSELETHQIRSLGWPIPSQVILEEGEPSSGLPLWAAKKDLDRIWMDEFLHHFESMVEAITFIGTSAGSSETRVSEWCCMDFAQPPTVG